MATIAQHISFRANQKERQLRALLRRDYGSRKYRITSGSTPEVHVYGRMPNTNKVGWWFRGWLCDVERGYCI